ncbi:MAG TPA: hypothetical protein DGG94_16750 [Micromonosporaceae bacterium]|nr:hypothetical protein [Micromonosporaceae bacterium]HCU51421.1 hypothetical protein [Micromonosporaceae bacterium]
MDVGGELFMPLSMMAIGTALRSIGCEIVLIDAQVEHDWKDLLRQHLPGASMFGVSCLTGPSIHAVLDGIAIARSCAPEVPIVWGGYHASQSFMGIFDEGLADYVVRGAGESAVVRLVEVLTATPPSARLEALAAIPNLVFRDRDAVRGNDQTRLESIELLAPLDYTLIDVERYFRDGQRTIHCISSYGCPHACTFCAEPTQSLRRWRGLSPARVVDEMFRLVDEYQPDLISFHDPNFSSNPNRVVEIVRELRRGGRRIPILCDMRARDIVRIAQMIDLKELREVGFESIFIGLESGSDRLLKLIRKGSTAADALSACRQLDRAGIRTRTSFIHDLPDENQNDSDLTFVLLEQLGALGHNQQSHHFYTPYPMTELYGQIVASKGILERDKSQREWADTSTYWGSKVWPGRADFRRAVLRRLYALQRKFPHAIERNALPVLRLIRPNTSDTASHVTETARS